MTTGEPAPGPVILVADDDPITRKVVVSALSEVDCREIHEVADGIEARDLLLAREVDIVITDLRMPGLDGLELIRWSNDHCPGPVWIILSGAESFDNAVEAMHLGAADFLPKPPRTDRLRFTVRNVWRHEALVRERASLDRDLARSNAELAQRVDQLESVCGILEDQAEVIQQDLKTAELIQRALLPQAPPRLPGHSVSALYRPGRHVGGDLYDAVKLSDRHAALVIADASGHGVSAAMLSVLFKHRLQLVDEKTFEPLEPGVVLDGINEALLADVSAPGVFVTAAYALLDIQRSSVTVASAGHPPLLHFDAHGEMEAIEHTGPALGLSSSAHYEQRTLQLEAGDRLLFYTDGLAESASLQTLCDVGGDPSKPALEALRELFATAIRSEAEDRDDISLLLLEASDGPGAFDHSVEKSAATRLSSHRAEMLYAEGDDFTYMRIGGRATWVDSHDFWEGARSVAESGRLLVLDFSGCEYLDSTFLGTIHEVVSRGEAAGGAVRLQGIRADVLKCFEELSMEAVLELVCGPELPAPAELRPLDSSDASDDAKAGQLRVLRAHETLASLSARNREQLEQVLTSLRSELRTPGASRPAVTKR